MKVKIEIVQGVEGPSIYIEDTRVAGPKPWGGGTVSTSWWSEKSDILKALGVQEQRAPAKGSGKKRVT